MTEYELANAKFNEAYAKYWPIMRAHSDIKIPMEQRPTADEFYAAKAKMDEATKAFDAAFAKAQGR